ncbi:MAG: hypothetical protein ACK55Z_27735, partial [bacterium]
PLRNIHFLYFNGEIIYFFQTDFIGLVLYNHSLFVERCFLIRFQISFLFLFALRAAAIILNLFFDI